VDIDHQAVEVAQLSLYLKLLEEETTASAHGYQLEFHETLLPSLDKNIVCGNSLVGTDFSLHLEEQRLVNAMDFEQRFPHIMTRGGFDGIVGNPPYGMVTVPLQKSYFNEHFKATEGRFDTFELFIEQAITLCRERGAVGYIVPSPLLSNLYARRLRRHILDNCSLEEVTNFGIDVFADPTIHTCIIILSPGRKTNKAVKVRKQVQSQEALTRAYDYQIPQDQLGKNPNCVFDIFFDPQVSDLLHRIGKLGSPLGGICFIRQCIKTGDDEKYVQTSTRAPGKQWKPSLRGRSIERYYTRESDLYVKYGSWLARNWANKSFYETPKIAIRETGNRITATLDLEQRYFLSSLYAIYPKSPTERMSLAYLLAILNSSLATYFVKKVALELTTGAFTKLRTNQLARLPIHCINFSGDDDKARHDAMVALVEQMLAAKKQLAAAQSDADKDFYGNNCAGLDRQIDALVYELYGLTAEEIKIVEGACA
jgi:hypothetical protein